MALLHRSRPTVRPTAILLGLLAQALFSWRLTTPHKLVFDEVHYVRAARFLGGFLAPTNIEHPLLGKSIIALGIAIFGDDALGWRIFSTFAGTATVLGVFAILWLLFGRLRTAVVGGLLTLVNFTVFIQARIAMLDGFMAAFLVLALAAMLWAMRGQGRAVWWRWTLGAALIGCAIGTKWTALPYLGFAGLAFAAVKARYPHAWRGLPLAAGWAILGGVALAVYFATFAPAFFYAQEPMTLARLIPFQLDMYRQQTQILPPHIYQSAWPTWALDIRPIWYLYEPVDGAQRGILMLGNPVVMWGGLIAVALCLWGWARDRAEKLGAVAALWIGGYGIWAIIPKSLGFFYYYYLPSIWLPIVIAAAFDHFGRGRFRYWDESFLVAAGGLFVYFYPILAATPLSGAGAFRHWMWFPTWP
jgi:dolichyl-phosphate-mannose--protein O-mannosyl transferase